MEDSTQQRQKPALRPSLAMAHLSLMPNMNNPWPLVGTSATPTNAAQVEERRNSSISPPNATAAIAASFLREERLPPPVVLQRQASEVSAWMSEVDSHYHSDVENSTISSEDEADDEAEEHRVVQTLQQPRVARIRPSVITTSSPSPSPSPNRHPQPQQPHTPPSVTRVTVPRGPVTTTQTPTIPRTITPHTTPNAPKENHLTRAFIIQSGGDDTSEASVKFHRKTNSNSPPTVDGGAGANGSPKESPEVWIPILQQRAAQAEERATSLTHRLALEERLHRQATADLRDAKWETSHLQEQLLQQQAKIDELEQQQRITKEWSAKEHRHHHQNNDQPDDFLNDQAQKQIRELVRDLKHTQEKVLRLEYQKMQLMRELATLQATADDQSARSSIKQPPQELREEMEQLQSELLEVRAAKLALETRLQDSLAKEYEYQTSLQQAHQDLSELEAAKEQLAATNETLTKRVRFADEQYEDYKKRHAELEIRYAALELESQQTTSQLQASMSKLQVEKNDLYTSLQQALDQQKAIQTELETLQTTSTQDKQALQSLAAQLDEARVSKEQMEVVHASELKRQQELLTAQQKEAKESHEQLQSQLEETLQNVLKLEHALKTSQEDHNALEKEHKAVLDQQASMHEQLAKASARLEELELERSLLQETIEQLQDDSEWKGKLQAADEVAAARQIEVLHEQQALQQKLETQQTLLRQVEGQVVSLQEQLAALTQEKEELMTQAAKVQDLLLKFQEEHGAMQLKCEESETKVTELQHQLEQAMESQKPLEAQVQASTERANRLEQSLLETQLQVQQLQQAHDELKMQKEELQDALDTSFLQLKSLEVKETEARILVQELEEARNLLHTRIHELESAEVEGQRRMQDANKRVLDLERAVQKEHEMAQQQAAALESRARELEVQSGLLVASHQEDIDKLQASNKDEINKVVTELEFARATLLNIENQLKEARSTLVEVQTQLVDEKAQNELLSKQLEKSTATISRLEKDQEAFKAEIEWLTEERDTLQNVQESLRQKLAVAEQQVQQLQTERDALVLELATSKEENRQLLAELNAVTEARDDLEGQLHEANARNNHLVAEVARQAEQVVLLQSVDDKTKSFQDELHALQMGKELVENKLREAESSIAGLERCLAEAQADATAARSEVLRHEESHKNLQQQVLSLQEEVDQLTSNRDALEQEKLELVARYEAALEETNKKFADATAEKEMLLREMKSMTSTLEVLTSEKSLVDTKLEQTLQALADSEEQLAKAKKEVAQAIAERDAALAKRKELEAQYADLLQKMETLHTDFEKIASEKEQLRAEKEAVTAELTNAKEMLRQLQAANSQTLVRQAQLESRNGELTSQLAFLEESASTLRKEIDSLGSERVQLLSGTESLSAEKAALLETLEEEKDVLRKRIELLESEKTMVVQDLDKSQQAMQKLDEVVKSIEDEALRSTNKQEALEGELTRLSDEKLALQTRVAQFETDVSSLRIELEVAKAAALDAQARLRESEEEKSTLRDEKAAALAHQAQLEAQVRESTSRLASLELLSADLHNKIRSVEEEKDSFNSVGVSGKAQDLHSETIEKIANELVASKEDNARLKKAAKLLVKKIRTLEAQIGSAETTFDYLFSLNSTPNAKGNEEIEIKELSPLQTLPSTPDKQFSPRCLWNKEGVESDSEVVRVANHELTLKMQYRDHKGEPQSYDVVTKYTGPMMNGLPDGPGLLRFENGDIYLGGFENGEMNGVGAFAHRQRQRHANQIFFGTFSNNDFQGDIKAVPPIQRVTAVQQ